MFRLIVILGLLLPLCPAEGKVKYPDALQISIWENQLYKGDGVVMLEVLYELYRLPREPWPEEVKQLFLGMVNKYYIGDNWLRWRSAATVAYDKCGEHHAAMTEMASWQADVRFIPILVENIGPLANRGLIKIGEPALLPIIKALRHPWAFQQAAAAETLGLMLKNNPAFAMNPLYRRQMIQGLFAVTNSRDEFVVAEAIDALKYIKDDEVIAHLNVFSRSETGLLRLRASKALQFMGQ